MTPSLSLPSSSSSSSFSKSGLSQMMDQNRETQLKVFEKMFLTQIQHQDPLNPMSTNELTQNIMTFHTAAEQARMNEWLEKLNANHLKSQAMTAHGYLNQDIEYQGDEFTFEGNPQQISFQLPPHQAGAELHIYNAQGEEIDRHPLPYLPTDLSSKVHSFSWEGKITDPDHPGEKRQAPMGQYHAKVWVHSSEGTMEEIPLSLKGRVRQVGYHKEGQEFALLVHNTPVELSHVTSLTAPPSLDLKKEIKELKDKLDNQLDFYESMKRLIPVDVDSASDSPLLSTPSSFPQL